LFSSPFATGGGGYRFESMVGGYYLLSLLKGSVTRGIDGITKEVKFQQRFAGHLLDDIVVVTNNGETDKKLSIQVRHKINFSRSDSDFNNLIIECWKMFTNQNGAKFDRANDRLGIAVSSITQKAKDHLMPVLEIARHSHSAESFLTNLTHNAHSEEKREYVKIINDVIFEHEKTVIPDADFWQFLRLLDIMVFDIENENSSDLTKCLDDASYLIENNDMAQARLLLDKLSVISAELAKHAGSVDLPMLKQLISSFHIKEPLNFTTDLQKLRRHSNNVLDYIHDKIGEDIQLPRTEQLNELEIKIKNNDVVFLRGEPFTGKSVLLKLLANHLRRDGEILVFSVDRLDGSDLDQFLKIIDVEHNFQDILSAIGSTPLRCILIDGLDQLPYQQNKIRIVKELFSTVKKYNKQIMQKNGHEDYCWKIVASCRIQEIKDALIILANEIPRLDFLEVSNLSDDEINQVLIKNEQLKDLFKKGNLNDILHKAGFLDMLIRRISLESTPIPSVITESWLYEAFWHQNVRLANGVRPGKGNANDRENVMKKIGLRIISENESISQSDDMDVVSVDGLLSDELIVKEDNHLRFSHDVFEDFTLVTILTHEKDNLINFLIKNKQSRRLLRPFDLYAAKILEVDKSPTKWFELLKSLENVVDLSPIWYHDTLAAPILSSIPREIISHIENYLLANKGSLLSKLLKILRTVAVDTDPQFSKLIDINHSQSQKVLSYFTIPIQEKWILILEFTLDNINKIDDHCIFEFFQTAYEWITRSRNIDLRKRISELSLKLFESRFIDEFGIKSSLSYDEGKKLRELLIKTVLWTADCMPDSVDHFLKKYALRNDVHYGFEEIIINDYCWMPICKYLPTTSTDILEGIFCEKMDESNLGYHDFHDLGIKSLPNYNPPTADDGPFLFFLNLHEDEGLDLIHRIVNHSTKVWKLREEKEYHKTPVSQILCLSTRKIEVYGDENVFRWFRFLSLGSAEVACALMALETWMTKKIEAGVNPKELFEKVLTGTSSVSTVGVCTSISLQFSKISQEAVIPILENPAFWYMDFRRQVEDLRAPSSIRSFAENLSFSEQNRKSYEKLIKLAEQLYRKNTLGDLVTPILITGPELVRHRMQDELEQFHNKVPIFYEEEKSNDTLIKERKRNCELWAARGKIENYKQTSVKEGQILLELNLESLLTTDEKNEANVRTLTMQLQNFWGWSYRLLDKNEIVDGFTIESAIDYIEKIDETFISNLDDFHKQIFIDAVSCFVSSIIVHRWETVVSINREKWCINYFKDILEIQFPQEHAVTIFPMRGNRAIAKALPYALLRAPKEKEFKKSILLYSVNENDEIRNFLFLSLRILWNVNDQIILNCIKLVIQKWSDLKDFRNETYTDLLKFLCILHVLHDLPALKKIQTKQEVKEILQKLLNLTICRYQERQREDGYNEWHTQAYGWNGVFFTVLSDILLRFDDLRSDIMNSIDSNWKRTPAMMEDFLRQLLLRGTTPELEEKLIMIWKHYFDKILNSQYIGKFTHEDGDYRKNILGLLIFADPTGVVTWKKLEWKPLNSMIPHIDLWCNKFSTNLDCLKSLITLLNTIGKNLVMTYGIQWLFNFLTKIKNERLMESRLIPKLSSLLWDIWNLHQVDIQKNQTLYRQFTTMVDLLVANNDKSAHFLKNKLG